MAARLVWVPIVLRWYWLKLRNQFRECICRVKAFGRLVAEPETLIFFADVYHLELEFHPILSITLQLLLGLEVRQQNDIVSGELVFLVCASAQGIVDDSMPTHIVSQWHRKTTCSPSDPVILRTDLASRQNTAHIASARLFPNTIVAVSTLLI